MTEFPKPTPIWSCKLGVRTEVDLPRGADAPMRRAVERAFYDITGVSAEFNFSGWSAELTEPELAVVENRIPGEDHYRQARLREAAPDLLEALKRLVAVYDDEFGIVAPEMDAALAAIAKAEPTNWTSGEGMSHG